MYSAGSKRKTTEGKFTAPPHPAPKGKAMFGDYPSPLTLLLWDFRRAWEKPMNLEASRNARASG